MSLVSQLILLVPLGLFQLVAVIAFSVSDGLSGWDWPVAVCGRSSGPCRVRPCQASAKRPRAAGVCALLGAQGLFSLVKLVGYGERASFLFLGLAALAAVGLVGRQAAAAAQRPGVPRVAYELDPETEPRVRRLVRISADA